jgi:hypothetical protein
VTGAWQAIVQRTAPRRDEPGAGRTDARRQADTNITDPGRGNRAAMRPPITIG